MDRYFIIITGCKTAGSWTEHAVNFTSRFISSSKRCSIQPGGIDVVPADDTACSSFCLLPQEDETRPAWLTSGSGTSIGDLLQKHSEPREDDNSLVEQLHKLCDGLPNSGELVDVLWLIQEEVHLQAPSDGILLYGVLKRLQEWHRARVTLAGCGPITAQNQKWLEVLCSDYTDYSEKCSTISGNTQVLWRGPLKLVTANNLNTTLLPGYQLQYEEEDPLIKVNFEETEDSPRKRRCSPRKHNRSPVKGFRSPVKGFSSPLKGRYGPGFQETITLATELEMLDVVQIQSIPHFYFTGTTLQLNINASGQETRKSGAILDPLQDDSICYLVRLRYGTKVKTEGTFTTIAWEEAIDCDASIMSKPAVTYSIQGHMGFHHFVLTLSQEGEELKYLAHLLYPPSRINGEVAHVMALNSMAHQPSCLQREDSDSDDFLDSLPFFPGTDFLAKFRNISIVQRDVLRKYIEWKKSEERSEVITVNEIRHILKVVHEKCFSFLQADAVRKKHAEYPLSQNLISECNIDGAHSIEKQCLVIKETSEKAAETARREKLCKQKSGEGINMFSPPRSNSVSGLNMDVVDLLSHFKRDGSAARAPPQPAQTKSSTRRSPLLPKFDSGDGKLSAWPECVHYQYHGIYYHRGVKTEKFENFCNKLATRLSHMETLSTCLGKARQTLTRRTSSRSSLVSSGQNRRQIIEKDRNSSVKDVKLGGRKRKQPDSENDSFESVRRNSLGTLENNSLDSSRRKSLSAVRTTSLGKRDSLVVGRKDSLVLGRRDSLPSSRRDSLASGRRESLTSRRRESLGLARRESFDSNSRDSFDMSRRESLDTSGGTSFELSRDSFGFGRRESLAEGRRDSTESSRRDSLDTSRRESTSKQTPPGGSTQRMTRGVVTSLREQNKQSEDEAGKPSAGQGGGEGGVTESERREKRSERHKRKLLDIVQRELEERGITKSSEMFKPAAKRLYDLTKSFVKDLKTSRNLRQVMEQVAKSNAQQVIDFEKIQLGLMGD